MSISSRSNRALSRFWGVILATMFYGFVMAGLLGGPAHKAGKPQHGGADPGSATAVAASRPATLTPLPTVTVAPLPVPARQTAAGLQPVPLGAAQADVSASDPPAVAAKEAATPPDANQEVAMAPPPRVARDQLPHRCPDGQWTWQPGLNGCSATPAAPRRVVVWRRVRRTCVSSTPAPRGAVQDPWPAPSPFGYC